METNMETRARRITTQAIRPQQAVSYVEIVSVSVPSSAAVGATVPVSIRLKALRGPTTTPNPLYAMRALALYQRYPFMATTPVTITMSPTQELVDAVGEEQTFTGSFVMPDFNIEVMFSLDYLTAVGGTWGTQGYSSSVVSASTVAPSQLDVSSLISLMITMMIVVMMMKMMGGMMSSVK